MTAVGNEIKAVLLVHSQEQVLQSLGKSLEDEGYRVLTARLGSEALLIMASETAEAMISEIWLPGMPGTDLARVVRERHRHVFTVLLTDDSCYCSPAEAILAGADAYLAKPVEARDLISLLKKARCSAARVGGRVGG